MICSHCKQTISDDYSFCPKCGAKVETVSGNFCRSCGRELKSEDVFCPGCGNKVYHGGISSGTEWKGSFIKSSSRNFVGSSGSQEAVLFSGMGSYRMKTLLNVMGTLTLTERGVYFSKTKIGDMFNWQKIVTGDPTSFFLPIEDIGMLRDGKAGLNNSVIISCGNREYNIFLYNRQQFINAFTRLRGGMF